MKRGRIFCGHSGDEVPFPVQGGRAWRGYWDKMQPGPDDWALQGMNRHAILRYSWRDRLRRLPALYPPLSLF